MSVQSQIREFAPHLDKYDVRFGITLLLVLVAGFAAFVPTPSISGFIGGGVEFMRTSGVIALITAWTAFIALYRLRHRPDKVRPTVREDFENCDNGDATDFGIRNFGPGPALYVQAVATVEQGDDAHEVIRLPVHDYPIHLREGDFASLVLKAQEDWLNEVAEKYGIGQSESSNNADQGSPPIVNLYFSYISQSGAREPTHIPTKRDDKDILDDLKESTTDTRHVKLSQVVEACRSRS